MKNKVEITLKLLKSYKSKMAQKEIFEKELDILSFIKAVDTTKPSVMSGNKSDPTADMAIRIAEAEEYQKLCEECDSISHFLLNITDREVKTIAMCYAVHGMNFEKIGEFMNYDRRTVSRKLVMYIAHNAR